MPSQKAVQEFKELYFKRFGLQLSDEEALEQSGRLLRLYKAVYGATGTDAAEESHEETL